MAILTAIISILVLTGLARFWNSLARSKICPICAGVAGTWIWMLLFWLWGYGGAGQIIDPLVIAILMGGSIVGIAYKLDKFVPDKLDLEWKTAFITLGFVAQYALLTKQIINFVLLLPLLVLLVWFFTRKGKETEKAENKKVERIKEGLEKCC